MINKKNHESTSTNNHSRIPNSLYKRQQKKKSRDPINVVFNYSKIKLTPSMEEVLNLGLNFAILPKKLDITQVLSDFKRFERSMIWKEFFYDKENIAEYKPPIFKSKKTNLPKNYKIPEELKIFLGAVKSEIIDPKNRNKHKCNISPDLLKALLQLVKLQRDRVIVIKRCDKGAGTIILDFDEYMRACNAHLGSKLKMKDGSTQEYYTKVDIV